MPVWKPFELVINAKDTIVLANALSAVDSLLLAIIRGEYDDYHT